MKLDFLNIDELQRALGTKDVNPGTEDIFFKLRNVKTNKELLNRVPHRIIEGTDMAITYSLFCQYIGEGVKSISIDNKWLSHMSEEKLYAYAYRNTRKLFKPCARPMVDVLFGLSKNEDDVPPVWVFTNEDMINGAVNILYKDLLREFSEQNQCSDLYIIPSSIHEVLLIPMIGDTSLEDRSNFLMMLREINEEIIEEEVLSDFVYIYDYERNAILNQIL